MGNSQKDMVNHPDHYISETGLETIDVIEAFTFDLKGIEATDTGNIIKYISRWKKKNGLEDLRKAQWYLNHLIEHVELLERENDRPRQSREYFHDDIVLGSIKEVMEVLCKMDEIINTYGAVSVADLYDLVGITGRYRDNTYGWTSLSSVETIRVRDGYMLKLPRVIPLN